jgi:circadian clock protein KaiC
MAYGLEMHLVAMHKLIDKFKPAVVIIDPISNMINVGDEGNVKFTLTRLVDYLKLKNITAVCTSLVEHESIEGINAQGISSLMDTWINLRFFENNSERNRGVAVIKSRGMEHSNQIREYLVTDKWHKDSRCISWTFRRLSYGIVQSCPGSERDG